MGQFIPGLKSGDFLSSTIKKSLLEQIVAELEKKKDLEWDIYNIGCAK